MCYMYKPEQGVSGGVISHIHPAGTYDIPAIPTQYICIMLLLGCLEFYIGYFAVTSCTTRGMSTSNSMICAVVAKEADTQLGTLPGVWWGTVPYTRNIGSTCGFKLNAANSNVHAVFGISSQKIGTCSMSPC